MRREAGRDRLPAMDILTSLIVYPEGEEQEIGSLLRIDQLVGLNGVPLAPPLPTHRMIAYRVAAIRRSEGKGETVVRHYLEIVPAEELLELVTRRGR